MMFMKFSSLRIFEEEGKFNRRIVERSIDELPPGDVLINVKYSALNYKDALSSSGHKGITRHFPHTPGVDAAGIVVQSAVPGFDEGDKVVVTGYDLGMNTDGGFGEYIRVPASWVVPLPDNMTLRESMILGTAGFTAGIAIFEFQRRGLFPGKGKILVTGATGGVGTVATAILSHLGYSVSVSTGKKERIDFLKSIGASEILSREDVADVPKRPLLERKWTGAIDNVGGATLNYCIKSTDYWGSVACVGLVDSDKLETTVYPFLLRGVALIGIDSADRPMSLRKQIWEKLAAEWKPSVLDKIYREITLDQLSAEIDKILAGGQTGRVIIKY
jgi:putative YhdH/YhfP family quinone oxidoreductase